MKETLEDMQTPTLTNNSYYSNFDAFKKDETLTESSKISCENAVITIKPS